MDMVKHKQFGMGEVVNKEVVGDYTYITARCAGQYRSVNRIERMTLNG